VSVALRLTRGAGRRPVCALIIPDSDTSSAVPKAQQRAGTFAFFHNKTISPEDCRTRQSI
jgi:hypothetical protein